MKANVTNFYLHPPSRFVMCHAFVCRGECIRDLGGLKQRHQARSTMARAPIKGNKWVLSLLSTVLEWGGAHLAHIPLCQSSATFLNVRPLIAAAVSALRFGSRGSTPFANCLFALSRFGTRSRTCSYLIDIDVIFPY